VEKQKRDGVVCFAVHKHVNTTASLAGFEKIDRKSQANKLRIFKMPTSVRYLGAISYDKLRLEQSHINIIVG
jgi:hypothetical protein